MRVKKLIGTDKGGLIGLITAIILVIITIITSTYSYKPEGISQNLIWYAIPIILIIMTLISGWLIFSSPYFKNYTAEHSKELTIIFSAAAAISFIILFITLFPHRNELPSGTDIGGPMISLTIIIGITILIIWTVIKKIMRLT